MSRVRASRASLLACLPRVIVRPMPKKITPNLQAFIRSIRSCHTASSTPVSRCTNFRIEFDPFGQGPQRPQRFEILARLDLDEDVGRLGTLGLAHVDDHAGAILAAVGQKHALRHQAVLGEVPRMAFGRVRAPEHDHVAAIGDFAQRAGHFAHALKRHARRAVADAGRGVDRAVDPVGDAHRHALRFAGRIAQAVDDRILADRQNLGGAIVAGFERGGLAVDQATRPIFDTVIQKPRLAQHAGPLGLDDVIVFDRQIDIVAHAAAERAGGVLNDLQLARNP